MSVGPGEDLNFLKKEFEEFLKGLICLPIKFPGTRLYKSLKVTIINEKNKTKKHNTNASALGFHIITNVYACSWIMQAKERLLKMVRKIVEERKLTMEEISDERGVAKDAVDVLLRDNGEANEKQSLSLDFISSNIIEMMIPGEETVPMAMTLAVKFLTDSPVALKQLTVRVLLLPLLP